SAKRFVNAFKFFEKYLSLKDENDLLKLLNIVRNASCTTHTVIDESEAIQMFIFQNNRGKKPSTLEIIKAEFMFHVHLYANDADRKELIEEIRQRFEVIYEAISSIEYKIHEDDVLRYTVRYFFNKLWEDNPQERIQKSLTDKTLSIKFIKDFTSVLAESFEYLKQFFNIDEKNSHAIHSIISLGQIGVAIPFILKSYFFNLDLSEREKLCSALEIILLRHRLIGTRADIISRLKDVYEKFDKNTPSIIPIIKRIEYLKVTDSWWYSYWNNGELENALNNRIQHGTAKYLLWKYENYLESQEKKGYQFRRYDSIIAPELEHIAPQTPKNNERVANGYPEYDDEFKSEYLNCLGNYLLISKSHNSSIGNSNFKSKRDSYKKSPLAQQREVFIMTDGRIKWSKILIKKRHKKIVNFLLTSI
ncbi:TPA: HNH endonuclease, partial [Pasteurella multocida]|nr:HNH endonuclease [Pasteurella multocida]